MPWIESHTVLIRHRKLIALAQALRIKPVHAMGHLHALWHAALEQREDGDLSSWSEEDISASAGFDGRAAPFVSLLQKHGWLNDRLLHDWLDYAGRYLESRYRTSNSERLKEIWSRHGREYRVSLSKVRASRSTDGPPTVPTYLPTSAAPPRLCDKCRERPYTLREGKVHWCKGCYEQAYPEAVKEK